MRITFATGIYPPDIGGPATYVSHLARDFFNKAYQVSVVTYAGGAEGTESESNFPIQRVSRSRPLPFRYLSFAAAVRRASRAPDVIYAQDPLSSGLPALVAARTLRRPFAVKIVGDLAWEIGSEQGRVKDDILTFQEKSYGPVIDGARRAQKFVARSAEHIIVPSEFLKSLVVGWGVRDDRIDVVYNSLPDDEIGTTREAARQELSFGPFGRDTVLVSSGRLVPWKRFDHLIRLMPAIRSVVSSARLLIIGTGPCEKKLKELVSELKLDEAVTLVGRVDADRMKLHLMASDILVLASSYEGFSHLLLESMRAGLPVVATDVGGNRELIQNGSNGILVPIQKRDRLTSVLIELCKSPASRARLAAAGRKRSKDFSWDNMINATIAALGRAQVSGHDRSATT